MTHYDVLNVSREASTDEIKRAYRSLSLKWHPDRNPSPEAISKFQEISAAYEILSDEGKRREYNFELDGGVGGQEVDISDIINMMFGQGGGPFGSNMGGPFGTNGHMGVRFGPGGGPFGPGGGPGPGIHIFHSQGFPGQGFPGQGFPGQDGPFGHPLFRQMQKPPPIMKQIDITFEQAYSGSTICVEIQKWVIQNDMKINEIEQVYVSIPAGIDQNELIIMRDCGNVASPDLKGDIKFIVKIGESNTFERRGMDLVHKRSITLKEALTGFSFELLHASGKTLCLNNLKNRTIVSPNYKKTIPNLGMTRDGNVGNLIIEFDVVFPDQLTEDQTIQLMAIL